MKCRETELTHGVKFLSVLTLFFCWMLTGCNNGKESLAEYIVSEYNCLSEQETGNTSESIIKWDEILYQEYENNLINNDKLREMNFIYGEKCDDTEEGYCELWGESYFGQLGTNGQVGTEKNIFLEGEPMTGILEAEIMEEDQIGMRVVVCDEMGVVEYIYYDLGDLQYFSCKGLEEREGDLPEYVVCYGVFEQNRVSNDSQEEKWKDFKERYGQKIKGDLGEYCIIGNKTYAIDREKKALANMSDALPDYVGKWLRQEAERVCCGIKVTSETFEEVTEMLPQGYFAANIGVCDLNQDGYEDYVITVYQSDKEEPLYNRNANDEIWMHLSDSSGNYNKKVLLSNVLFQCATLKFVSEGMLMCENVVGNEGYEVDPCRMDYFLYDKEMEDFCLYKAYLGEDGYILIYDEGLLGKLTIEEYYQSKFNEIEEKNIYNALGVDIYCEYIDSKVISGSMCNLDYEMPVIIDVKDNSFLNVMEMISKEEMVQICRRGMKSLYRNKLSQNEIETYVRYIEEAYDSTKNISLPSDFEKSEEKVKVYFKITSWGVCIICVDKAKNDEKTVIIDKEFFINTPLWHYIEPNF